MEFKDIIYEERDSVAYIAINRPEVMNAFRGQTVEELGELTYHAVASETLKQTAITCGVDHTVETHKVLQRIAAQHIRQKDVIRELRRHVAALERTVARLSLAAPVPPSPEGSDGNG